MSEVKNIPRLRFPEFEKEWLNYSFDSVSTFYNGRAYKQNELLDKGKYPVLRVGNLFTNNEWYYSNLELDENKYIDHEDLIYAWSASFGPRIWYGEKVIYHYHIWKVVIDETIVSKRFYFQILENETIKMKTSSSNGFALLHITKGTIENWKSFFPSLPEQQKIADFLTAVDKRIELLEKKKTLLETYKKGVMKKIFPSTSSGKNPEIRFKDDNGNDFPDWEEKRLGEIMEEFIVPMRDKPKKLDGEIPWCRIEDFNGIYLTESKSNQGVTIETVKEMNLKIFPINTILVSCSANLGVCSIVKFPLITNQTFIGLVPKNEISPEFIYYIMNLSARRLNSLSSGTTISYLSRREFENFRIRIPLLREQIKVSNFLLNIDTQVRLLQSKIDKSKTWKKGLLQKMFV